MSKGVFLIAFGSHQYGRAAWNLAVSIKHFDPDLQIALLHDHRALEKGLPDISVFDTLIPMVQDNTEPGKVKTTMYHYLPFDHTLYLDVDAVALGSLTDLIDHLSASEGYYYTHVHDYYSQDAPEEMAKMFWAYKSDIWKKYDLNGYEMPASQSSVQFIRKCPEAEDFFIKLNENIDNPIPLESLRNQWGGAQPDELYINITCAQLGLRPHIGDDVMFFSDQISKFSNKQITENYKILSVFGGKNFTRPMYKVLYDSLMTGYCKARGLTHNFKAHYIL